ncbi:MAG: ArsR/SmtB family transcription factor, partial [Thermoplasmatota archaeon]
MPRIRVAASLADRLESLTGEDGAGCATGLAEEAAALRASRGFARGLERAKALGDEKRFVVAALLSKRREMCACEVQAALGLTHATVSHHMGVLEAAGLVETERRGKWAYYRLTRDAEALL